MRLPHRALPVTTSLLTASVLTTSVLLAGSVLVPGSATAGIPAATSARGGASLAVHRDAPGQDPKTRDGQGPFALRLSNTADGRILVRWSSKAKAKRLKKWKVITSTTRTLSSDVTVYQAGAKKRSIIVRHAPSVTPSSGDYTFVKLVYRPKHGKGGGSPVHWIQAPVTAVPAGAGRATIGTFNVRDSALDKSGPNTWEHRKPRVISTIASSGAGVVNLQEASGMAMVGGHWDLTQMHDIANGTHWNLVSDEFFLGSKSASQGTRILYNPNRVTLVPGSEGHKLLTGDRFIEWAEFTDKASGRRFWDVSIHLYSGKKPSYENIRVQEAKQVIAVARALAARDGAQVFVAGDSNSTIYTAPKGLVHRTFIGAGFYDAFATRSIANQAFPTTNDFDFPVKPSPHRRDLIMSFDAPRGSYWYRNVFYNSSSQAASDHFMQVAQLPLH